MAEIVGTDSDDTLSPGQPYPGGMPGDGPDALFGLLGNDSLDGGGGNDTLTGDAGDDTLVGGSGADSLDGGTGRDRVSYAGSPGQVVAFLEVPPGGDWPPLGPRSDARGDLLIDIEDLTGSSHADSLFGSFWDNALEGGSGADSLVGSGGHDTLLGGLGSDSLEGGSGDDVLAPGAGITHWLEGGQGEDLATYSDAAASVRIDLALGLGFLQAAGDTLVGIEHLAGSAFVDTLRGDAAANRLDGDGGNDSLVGADGTDTLRGGAGGDRLDGGSEDDLLEGAEGNDVLYGGAGSDTLHGGTGADRIVGGADWDLLSYADAASGVEVDLGLGRGLAGEAEGDTLISIELLEGSAFADLLRGDDRPNRLTGGAGADTLDGGAGRDTAAYAGSAAAVLVDLAAGTGVGGDAEGDRLTSIENLSGSGGNDTLHGNALGNRLHGAGMDDVLEGGLGADTLDGDWGSDTASYATAATRVLASLAQGGFTAEAKGDIYLDIENLEGSAFADSLEGDANWNRLAGGSGGDTLAGGDGWDTLEGSSGNDLLLGGGDFDQLLGGAGADTLAGGTGFANSLDGGADGDLASYAGRAGPVRASLAEGRATGDGFEDTLLAIENLLGTGAADTLIGDGGANRLLGDAGNDRLIGGIGADTLDGGGGIDVADYQDATAGIRVVLGRAGTRDAAEGDRLRNIEQLLGSHHADELIGSTGAETLDGNGGLDTLRGGGGADLLRGTGALVSYIGSAAVRIDLEAGLAEGGDAQGDTLEGVCHVLGGGDDDVLAGDTFNNRLSGGFGADTIVAGIGADTLDGGAGLDDAADFSASYDGLRVDLAARTADGGSAVFKTLIAIEHLQGGIWNDWLRGNAAANRLVGGEGADTLDGGSAGADTLAGGGGRDLAAWDGRTSSVAASLAAGTTGDGGLLTGIEDLRGGGGSDRLEGNGTGNRLEGAAGADTLSGSGGDDTLLGGLGADRLEGSDGFDLASYAGAAAGVAADYMAGGTGGEAQGDVYQGIEALEGSAFADTLTDGAGSATLLGALGNDLLRGGAGDDSLDGEEGDDLLEGGAGNDWLIGGSGIDTLSYAGSGNSVLIRLGDLISTTVAFGGDASGDSIHGFENVVGSAFNDTLHGRGDANRLEGGDGDDELLGGGAADTLEGGEGADTLSGGEGSDVLVGGAGRDLADFSGLGWGLIITLILAGSTPDGDIDILSGVEDVYGTLHADTIQGSATAAAWLAGAAGDDSIRGLDATGGDTLVGGAGADTLRGTGRSMASYEDAVAGVTVDLAAGIAGGEAATDLLIGIGGLRGSGWADSLAGHAGENRLVGGGGDDRLDGKAGADTLEGGLGRDTLTGGEGVDWATYGNSTAGVQVSLWLGGGVSVVGREETGDILIGIENLHGSAFADTLDGDSGGNLLRGDAGDDLLEGREGDDTLAGGAGADTLRGGAGHDTASYAWAESGVLVRLGAGAVQGEAIGDLLTDIEGLLGSAFADTLIGGEAADTIEGGAGDDSLAGGAGTDVLSYRHATAAIRIDLGTGLGSLGDAAGDQVSGFENVYGSAFSDTITGDAAGNYIHSGGGADSLSGAEGDDTIEAGGDPWQGLIPSGVPTGDVLVRSIRLNGGTGFDMVSWADGTAAVSFALGLPSPFQWMRSMDWTLPDGSVLPVILQATLTLSGFEGAIGTDFADTLEGQDALAMYTYGTGQAENRLEGGAGDDLLIGRHGADTLIGGGGFDLASYRITASLLPGSTEEGPLLLDLVTGEAAGAAAGDVLIGVEGVLGWDGADTLRGSVADNLLAGGGGDDWLSGRSGADTLDGGEGIDTADYSEGWIGGFGVVVNLATGFANGLSATGDKLVSIENLIGTGGTDQLTGDTADNLLRGGGGADLLDGGAGRDTASYAASLSAVFASLDTGQGKGGDAEGDTLQHIENVIGSGNGGDTLFGDAGDNLLDGGGGVMDLLRGGTGADTLLGEGATASYTGSATGVAVNLQLGRASGGDAEGDVLVGIADLIGSNGADTLVGNAMNNHIEGGIGDDLVAGGTGLLNDTLMGGAGNDTLSYALATEAVLVDLADSLTGSGDVIGAFEAVIGSAFADTLYGTQGGNTLAGGGDGDLLDADYGNDLLEGGDGADTLLGGIIGDADTIHGGDGVDTLFWFDAGGTIRLDLGEGRATLGGVVSLLSGVEAFHGGIFNDTLLGSVGDDYLNGDFGTDVVEGSDGNDTLSAGTGGEDTLRGGSGDDLLIGGPEANMLIGGTGNDTADFSGLGFALAHDLNVAWYISGSNGLHRVAEVEAIRLTAYADRVFDDIGLDLTFILDGGIDTINGGGGYDFVDLGGSSPVHLELAAGQYRRDGATGVLQDVEGAIGSLAADTLEGSSWSNDLRGDVGNDLLAGGNGRDTLEGGAGADTLWGQHLGDLAIDTWDFASYRFAAGPISAKAAAGGYDDEDTAGEAKGDVYASGIYGIIGSRFNDTLRGNIGADLLIGGEGNDLFYGSIGRNPDFINDTTMRAPDAIEGGAGIDELSYAASAAGVCLDLAVTYTSLSDATGGLGGIWGNYGQEFLPYLSSLFAFGSGGDADLDMVSGIENITGSAFADTLGGNDENNLLRGQGGGDVLSGGAGADTLVGGAGGDVLNGGAGRDVALFGLSGPAIVNFETGVGGAGDAAGDVLTSIEKVVGGSGNDIFILGASPVIIEGGEGADTADFTHRAAVVYDAATAVEPGGDIAVWGFRDVEIFLGSAGNDQLRLTGLAETVHGNGGADSIDGGGGADLLIGGVGADTLAGGANGFFGDGAADRFLYVTAGDSAADAPDYVIDFETGTDRIDLSAVGTTIGGWNAERFVQGAFTGAGQLRWTGGALELNLDGNLSTVEMRLLISGPTGFITVTEADVIF